MTPEDRVEAKLTKWADLDGAETGMCPLPLRKEFVSVIAEAIREAEDDVRRSQEKRLAPIMEAMLVIATSSHRSVADVRAQFPITMKRATEAYDALCYASSKSSTTDDRCTCSKFTVPHVKSDCGAVGGRKREIDVPTLISALECAITTTKHDIYILEHDASDPAIVSPILEQNKQHLKRLEQAQATLRQFKQGGNSG